MAATLRRPHSDVGASTLGPRPRSWSSRPLTTFSSGTSGAIAGRSWRCGAGIGRRSVAT